MSSRKQRRMRQAIGRKLRLDNFNKLETFMDIARCPANAREHLERLWESQQRLHATLIDNASAAVGEQPLDVRHEGRMVFVTYPSTYAVRISSTLNTRTLHLEGETRWIGAKGAPESVREALKAAGMLPPAKR